MKVLDLAEADKQSIIEWAQLHQEIVRVWLYGSRARGDHPSDSDIDLAVETAGANSGERMATWMLADRRNDLRLSGVVHLEWYDPEAKLDRVGPGVQRDGQLIYQAVHIR